jgi:hypothetical protein
MKKISEYSAKLAQGAVWARKQFADEASSRAAKAALNGNLNDALMFSQEANRHEKAIIALMRIAGKGSR